MKIVIENLPALSVWVLHRVGLFRAGRNRRAVLRWRWGERETLPPRREFSATVRADADGVTIEYTHNGRGETQRVEVRTIPANLGGGSVPMFVCPETGRNCRTLYFWGGRFVSRYAFRGFYYAQTLHDEDLITYREQAAIDKETALLDQTPRHRLSYAGKPTRYALKLDAAAEKTNRASNAANAVHFFNWVGARRKDTPTPLF